MSDIGLVSETIASIVRLTSDILNRKDRDEPDSENEKLKSILQQAYVDLSLDSDEFRLFVELLCTSAGNPITPQRDVGTARRELVHALILNTIDLIRERRRSSRLENALINKSA